MITKNKPVVFAFGRFTPVHAGHENLVNVTQALGKKVGAPVFIYASKTQDAKKNPLSIESKLAYMRHAFPGVNINGATESLNTFLKVAEELNKKFDVLYMTAGSDRVVEYKKTLDAYNGKLFNYKNIYVISTGERDPDADGASGLSASKMRAAAVAGNFTLFKSGCPSKMSVSMCKKMYDDVRAGLKITEETNDLREKYIKEELFNIGDIVEHEGVERSITFRGSNYVILENNTRVWLKDITPTGKVNESMKFKQEDKIKVARIIGMALGYLEAEDKMNPTAIINTALRMNRNKAMNPEAKKILARMLQTARDAGIPFDDKLAPTVVKEEKSVVAYQEKKGIVADDDHIEHLEGKPTDDGAAVKDSEKANANLMTADPKPEPETIRRRKIMYKVHEESESEELSDEDVDKLVDELDDEHFIEHAYDDEEFAVVSDDEDDKEEVKEDFDYTELTEVLSRAERMRARVRFAQSKNKRQQRLKIVLRQRSSTEVLARRARKAAVKALELRLAKKPLNQLSVSEKERVEARVARMKNTVTKLATRLIPKVRQIEKDRLSAARNRG